VQFCSVADRRVMAGTCSGSTTSPFGVVGGSAKPHSMKHKARFLVPDLTAGVTLLDKDNKSAELLTANHTLVNAAGVPLHR